MLSLQPFSSSDAFAPLSPAGSQGLGRIDRRISNVIPTKNIVAVHAVEAPGLETCAAACSSTVEELVAADLSSKSAGSAFGSKQAARRAARAKAKSLKAAAASVAALASVSVPAASLSATVDPPGFRVLPVCSEFG